MVNFNTHTLCLFLSAFELVCTKIRTGECFEILYVHVCIFSKGIFQVSVLKVFEALIKQNLKSSKPQKFQYAVSQKSTTHNSNRATIIFDSFFSFSISVSNLKKKTGRGNVHSYNLS